MVPGLGLGRLYCETQGVKYNEKVAAVGVTRGSNRRDQAGF